MILDFVAKVLKTVIGAVGSDSIKQAAATIEQAISGDDQLRIELARLELEEKRLIEKEAEARFEAYKVELQSEDKFVRRVRPTIVYTILGILGLNFAVLTLANTIALWCGWTPITLVYPNIPDQFYWLADSAMVFYMGARSYDKRQKSKTR